MMRSLLALALTVAFIGAEDARAAEIQDLDGGSRKQAKSASRERDTGLVREIERGYFMKANLGSTMYLAPRGFDLLDPGTTVALSVGQDFIDRERMSVSWELMFHQTLNNGSRFNETGGFGLGPDLLIQGDIHTYTVIAAAEVSTYPTRRLGLGARAGAGVTLIPLLMFPSEYETQVVNGAWGGNRAPVHDGPKPVILIGPTLEYYTKLSHFSVGVDVDMTLAIGFELGLSSTGYLKYTF